METGPYCPTCAVPWQERMHPINDCQDPFHNPPAVPADAEMRERAKRIRRLTALPYSLIAIETELTRLRDATRFDECAWWWDYTFGKSQSGKLGIERLQEASDRLARAAVAAGKPIRDRLPGAAETPKETK